MDRSKAIDRVQKLLALSNNNPSQEEATAALLRAQKLMVEHGIDFGDVQGNNNVTDEVIEKVAASGRRMSNWKIRLAVVIAQNFRCETYIQKSGRSYGNRNAERVSYQREVMFVGMTTDVEIATMVYQKAIEFADLYCNWFMLQEKLRLQRVLTRSESKQIGNTWRIGFVLGLKQKFDEQVAQNDWGLVLVTPEAVTQYMTETHGKLVKRQSSRVQLHRADAFEDGIEKGKKFGSENQEKQESSANRGPKRLMASNS